MITCRTSSTPTSILLLGIIIQAQSHQFRSSKKPSDKKRKRYAIRVPQLHNVSASVPRVRRLELKGEREKEGDEICGCTIAEKEIHLGGFFWMSCLDQFDGYPSGCDISYGNCSLLSFFSRLNIRLPFSYQSLT